MLPNLLYSWKELNMAAFIRFSEPGLETTSVRFQANGWKVNNRTYSWSPPTDVYETETNLMIRIEIAGMRQSDITIGIEDNFLVVSGIRKEMAERRAYHQMEIRFGEFSSIITLPKGVDLDDADADYEDGFLTISIPINKATNIRVRG
jgi:HSP20 family protein